MLKYLQSLPRPAQWFRVSPRLFLQSAKVWALASGVWWLASVSAHVVVLSGALLLLGTITSPRKEGEAPAFEARVETDTPVPALDHFDVGQTPLEPTELNTETLSLVDAPQIDAEPPMGEASDALAGGGSVAGGGIGGLDQFGVKALGPGPLVRGSGLAAAGSNRSPGSGGLANGFGARGDKDSRRAMVGGYGGTKGTERAVAAALNWLARHQSPDGSWSYDGYIKFCKGEACLGVGDAKTDVAATAMALLPFFAAGQTHRTKGPYQRAITAGLSWMISRQKSNGDLTDGAKMYTHGLAAIALCEAYGLSKDPGLARPAQAAIDFIEYAQNPVTGGWHYDPRPPTIGDTSVGGWQVMALKSAQMVGLDVHEPPIDGARKWFKSVAHGKSGGLFSYQPTSGSSPTMTSVGLLCSQYMGAKRQDAPIQEGMAYLLNHMPSAEQRNCYYWYYATQVLHNVPGPEWDTWNRQMRRVLIESQSKEGCAAGSWDPDRPMPDPWGKQGGRIMTTSLCCLTLEVYYRYLPLYKIDAEEAASAAATRPGKSTADK